MEPNDEVHDAAFHDRARRRLASSWARVIDRSQNDDPDPDDLASSEADRVALVDTLTLIALRTELPDGIEPRLQRSIVRVYKRTP